MRKGACYAEYCYKLQAAQSGANFAAMRVRQGIGMGNETRKSTQSGNALVAGKHSVQKNMPVKGCIAATSAELDIIEKSARNNGAACLPKESAQIAEKHLDGSKALANHAGFVAGNAMRPGGRSTGIHPIGKHITSKCAWPAARNFGFIQAYSGSIAATPARLPGVPPGRQRKNKCSCAARQSG